MKRLRMVGTGVRWIGLSTIVIDIAATGVQPNPKLIAVCAGMMGVTIFAEEIDKVTEPVGPEHIYRKHKIDRGEIETDWLEFERDIEKLIFGRRTEVDNVMEVAKKLRSGKAVALPSGFEVTRYDFPCRCPSSLYWEQGHDRCVRCGGLTPLGEPEGQAVIRLPPEPFRTEDLP